MKFELTIAPHDGMYRGGKFVFDFTVPKSYPHDAPKVLCKTTVFHPNLDMEARRVPRRFHPATARWFRGPTLSAFTCFAQGHVCLNILREDWKPVLTIQSIVMGLQFLMLEPNADDPLNKEAANLLAENPRCAAARVWSCAACAVPGAVAAPSLHREVSPAASCFTTCFKNKTVRP